MASISMHTSPLPTLESEIIRTVLYFDLFNHPLTLAEINRFTSVPLRHEGEFKSALKQLLGIGLLIEENGYYWNGSRKDNLFAKRIQSEKEALPYFRKARFFSSIIQAFPFTIGVAVSGSLSKGCMYPDGDIDYFIITKRNRLWINRMLLTLFKKVFLLNSKKYFCINYFVTEDNLKIKSKNIFTAVEIDSLLPLQGKEQFEKFFVQNKWVDHYFPNREGKNLHQATAIEYRSNWVKFGMEKFLNGKLGDWMDDFFMNVIRKAKEQKFKSNKSFEIAFKSDKNVSKHHPENRQQKVPILLADKIMGFEKEMGVKLSK